MSWRALSLLVLTSWGALAFGAVYPWAFIPLYAGCTAVGVAAFLQRKGTSPTDVVLAGSLLFLGLAIGLQLVPLPVSAIRSLSPETDVFLQRYALGYGTFLQRHALSIEPSQTARALMAGSG